MICELCESVRETYRLVFEDELVFCVITKYPLKEGHVMILPKRHVEKFSDLDLAESKSIFNSIELMRSALSNLFSEDIIIHINSGNHSTQKHIHVHILPSKGSLRKLISSFENIPEREEISIEDMERLKINISDFL